jgi:hypothetical protein
MSYEEFQRQVFKAGLTIKSFADLMCMNRISLSNLSKKGTVPDHWAVVAVLMAEMKENGLDFVGALTKLSLGYKKPRGAGMLGKFGGDRQQVLPIDGGSGKRPIREFTKYVHKS